MLHGEEEEEAERRREQWEEEEEEKKGVMGGGGGDADGGVMERIERTKECTSASAWNTTAAYL